jgi:PKD repeat protein
MMMELGRKRVMGFRVVSVLIVCLLLAASFGPVGARPPASSGPIPQTAIYSDVLGEVNNDVPGFPGVHFEGFDRPFGSPNGNWILSADTDNPTTNDEIVIVNGVVKYFEGDAAPWTGGAENIGLTDTKLGINDAAEWIFANNTSATTNDDYIVRVSAGDVYTTVAREGDPVTQLPPATWDDTLDSSVISADGTVGHAGDGIDGGPPTTEDEIVVFGSSVIAQQGVTVPGGQVGTETWEFFDFEDFFVSADGLHWILQGDLTGDTNFDDVAAVDGNVVVQEGVVLPGSGFAEPVDLNGIVGVWMASNGDWFVRGNNDVTEQDWVYSNGAVIAERGAPIHAGATELYSDTAFADLFFMHVGDSLGNYVIGGVSDNPDPLADGVLVLNDQVVIARQGDPIDLDNNGTFDDDVFINTFGNDDGFLDDAGNFYFVATMMDAAGAAAGDVFLVYDLSGILGGGNTAPTLTNVAAVSPIDENDSTTLTGDMDDLDEDPLSLVVNWGDGTVMTYTYPSGTTAFTETHQYLDDDPTATPFDIYGVTLALSDDSGNTATAAVDVTVNNVSPTASVTADSTTVEVNTPVNFTGVFTDVGTLDTHTIAWGFGDGNVDSGTLTPSHTFTATGDYMVLLSVEDDDLGVGTASITITVTPDEPTDVSLSSFGDGTNGPGLMLWLLPLLALLGVVPLLVARRRKAAG